MLSKSRKLLAYILVFIFAAIVISCSGSDGDNGDIKVSMSMPLLQEAKSHGEGVGWQRTDCFNCHPTPDTASHPALLSLPGLTAEEVCMSCHLDNGVNDSRFKIPQCVRCHTSSSFPTPMHVTGTSAHTVSSANAVSLSDLDCIICHDSTNMDGVMDYNDLSAFGKWNRGDLNGFCLTCHSSEGVITQSLKVNGENMVEKYASDYHGANVYSGLNNTLRAGNSSGMELSCLSCHKQHSSTNRSLFIEYGSETGVVTESAPLNAPIKITVENPYDLRDLCAVCHGQDSDPESTSAPNGLKQVVHKYYCYDCHSENSMRPPSVISLGRDIANVMMEDGRSCTACHYHGVNSGPRDYSFPKGVIHSKF